MALDDHKKVYGYLNTEMTLSLEFIAAIVIALVTAVIMWLLGLLGLAPGGGWLGALVSLVIAAVILMISDRFVSGMRVNGFVGAIVAAIAIGVVTWLINWILSLFL